LPKRKKIFAVDEAVTKEKPRFSRRGGRKRDCVKKKKKKTLLGAKRE